MLIELKARRWISRSRVASIPPAQWERLQDGPSGAVAYDAITDAYTEFVVVDDGDSRAETVEFFDPPISYEVQVE